MKCVIYCRVSTDRQREAGTIESQREALIQFARAQNWTVVSVEEDDGFSGTVPAWERPGMARALRLIESRAVDYLLVVDLDRTSRAEDPFERAIVRKALRDHGVLLATPKGILRDITPEEKLTQDMLSSVASYERSKTRERTVRGRKDAVLRKGGRPLTQTPLGLQWSPETHGYIASPVEAPVVREIFRLATEGLGPLQIERELVRRNMPSGRMQRYRPRGTPKGTAKELGTKFIVRRSIQDILANPVFCSDRWAPNPAWDPNFTVSVEPIVTREQWDAANAALRGRARRPGAHGDLRLPAALGGVLRPLPAKNARTNNDQEPEHVLSMRVRQSPASELSPLHGEGEHPRRPTGVGRLELRQAADHRAGLLSGGGRAGRGRRREEELCRGGCGADAARRPGAAGAGTQPDPGGLSQGAVHGGRTGDRVGDHRAGARPAPEPA